MSRSGAREIRSAAILCVLTSLLAASAHAQDDPRAKLAGFVAVGTDLYDRAAKIVAQEPKTDADILGISMMTGDQWQRDERAFQISFWPMAHDEAGTAKEGDTVVIVPCRPMSRHKSWKVSSVTSHSQAGRGASA